MRRLALPVKPGITVADISCDSDGKIIQFIDLQDVRDHFPVHPLNGKPYYIAVFLVGAYQDIMGDLHNHFGRLNEAHVFFAEDDIEDTINGNQIGEVLDGVLYDPEDLRRQVNCQIDHAIKRDVVKLCEGTPSAAA